MEKESAEIIFWVIHLPLMLIFLGGMGFTFSRWLRGSVSGCRGDSAGQKLGAVIRIALQTVFSAKLWLLIKALIVEAWFNRRLYRNDRWRWGSHFFLLTGVTLLFILSGISALSVKVLIHFFHLEYIPPIGIWDLPDHPVTAILNEIGAVMMTAGFLVFVVRRYILRVPQLRSGPMDHWMVIGIGLILLSGWVAEIVRLSSTAHVLKQTAYLPVTTTGFSFIGHPISLLVRRIPLDWDGLTYWMYAIHGVITSAVIATIPFSKFMHGIAGALTLIIRDVEEKGAAHV